MKYLVVAAAAFMLASGAQAATFDAFSSFNGAQGAGGFTYIKLPGPAGGAATPLFQGAGR